MHQNTSCTLCLVYLLQGQFVSFSFFFNVQTCIYSSTKHVSSALLFVYDFVEIWYKSLAVWLAWILNSKPLANIVIGSSHQDLSYLQRNTGCFSYSTTCSHMKISNIKKKLNNQEHFFFTEGLHLPLPTTLIYLSAFSWKYTLFTVSIAWQTLCHQENSTAHTV